MGDIVKLALRLFIFALVASVLLAVTNEVTKGPIEQQKLASKMEDNFVVTEHLLMALAELRIRAD